MNKHAAIGAGLSLAVILVAQNFTATQSKLVQGAVAFGAAYVMLAFVAPKVGG